LFRASSAKKISTAEAPSTRANPSLACPARACWRQAMAIGPGGIARTNPTTSPTSSAVTIDRCCSHKHGAVDGQGGTPHACEVSHAPSSPLSPCASRGDITRTPGHTCCARRPRKRCLLRQYFQWPRRLRRCTRLGNDAVRSPIPLGNQRALGGDQLAHVHDMVAGGLHGGPDVVKTIRTQERHGLRHRLSRPPAPHHEGEAGEAGAELLAEIP